MPVATAASYALTIIFHRLIREQRARQLFTSFRCLDKCVLTATLTGRDAAPMVDTIAGPLRLRSFVMTS